MEKTTYKLTQDKLIERANKMRANPTRHEKIFRNRLLGKGVDFYEQVIIGFYIADFVIGNIIIEIDGESHFTEEAIEYDKKRTAFLERSGYIVRRILNSDVRKAKLNEYLKPVEYTYEITIKDNIARSKKIKKNKSNSKNNKINKEKPIKNKTPTYKYIEDQSNIVTKFCKENNISVIKGYKNGQFAFTYYIKELNLIIDGINANAKKNYPKIAFCNEHGLIYKNTRTSKFAVQIIKDTILLKRKMNSRQEVAKPIPTT